MFQEDFAGSPLLGWPLVGLVIFVLAFVGVLVYALVGLRDRRRVDRLAALPLEGDGTLVRDLESDVVSEGDRDERTEG